MKKKLIVFGVSFLIAAGIITSVCLIETNKTEAAMITLQTNEEESTTQEETVVIEEETIFTIENCEETTNENILEEETTTTTKWLFRRFWSDGTLYAETEYDFEPTEDMINAMIADWESNGNYLVDTIYTDLPSVDLYFAEKENTNTVDISNDYIVTAYNIPEYQIERAMKLVTIEGYWMDEYFDYLMACTVINRLIEDPYCEDIYAAWGGNDGWYGAWMDSYGIADHARNAVNQALENLDTRAWDCHGLVAENGYSSIQLLSESIYYINYNGTYFGIWDRNAGWYQV